MTGSVVAAEANSGDPPPRVKIYRLHSGLHAAKRDAVVQAFTSCGGARLNLMQIMRATRPPSMFKSAASSASSAPAWTRALRDAPGAPEPSAAPTAFLLHRLSISFCTSALVLDAEPDLSEKGSSSSVNMCKTLTHAFFDLAMHWYRIALCGSNPLIFKDRPFRNMFPPVRATMSTLMAWEKASGSFFSHHSSMLATTRQELSGQRRISAIQRLFAGIQREICMIAAEKAGAVNHGMIRVHGLFNFLLVRRRTCCIRGWYRSST